MIIINLQRKIKPINQHIYNLIINSIHFNEIPCPNCNCSCWYSHGYYYRHVDLFNRHHKIKILRFRCCSCNQTHAVLIEDMIPYSLADFDVVFNIAFCLDHYYSSYDLFIKLKYSNFSFSYQSICLFVSRSQNKLLNFSTQLLKGFFLFHVKLNS